MAEHTPQSVRWNERGKRGKGRGRGSMGDRSNNYGIWFSVASVPDLPIYTNCVQAEDGVHQNSFKMGIIHVHITQRETCIYVVFFKAAKVSCTIVTHMSLRQGPGWHSTLL